MSDLQRLLRALYDPGAELILCGGVAAVAHGSARLTQDIDVIYRRSAENLDRIVGALAPHHPYLRGAPPGLPFRLDRETLLRGLNFMLTTDLGDIDLLGEIVGGGGYEALAPQAIQLSVFGMSLRCLSLEQLIRAKRAAGRPKDLEVIAELEAIRDEQRK
jgi:hypothetical protein